jgi:hypothetical protein
MQRTDTVRRCDAEIIDAVASFFEYYSPEMIARENATNMAFHTNWRRIQSFIDTYYRRQEAFHRAVAGKPPTYADDEVMCPTCG